MSNATAQHITATKTALPNGKTKHTVMVDGEVYDTRTSARSYNFIHIQRWAPLGSDGKYGAADKFAVRYGAKPKPVGAKIEYGFCAASISIDPA